MYLGCNGDRVSTPVSSRMKIKSNKKQGHCERWWEVVYDHADIGRSKKMNKILEFGVEGTALFDATPGTKPGTPAFFVTRWILSG
jgi:hypothetical protein